MNRSGWIFGIGLIVVIAGLLVIAGSVMPDMVDTTMTIARGEYATIELPTMWKGELWGYFTASPNAVMKALVLTSHQYKSYIAGTDRDHLAELPRIYLLGSDVPINSIRLPELDRVYIVLENQDAGGAPASADASVHYELQGTAIYHLAAGAALVAGSAVAATVAFRIRGGEGKIAPPDPMAIGESQELYTKRSPQR